jgi:hypothetical protein
MFLKVFITLLASASASSMVAGAGSRSGNHVQNVLDELKSLEGNSLTATTADSDEDTTHMFNDQLLDHFTTSVLNPSADRVWDQRL